MPAMAASKPATPWGATRRVTSTVTARDGVAGAFMGAGGSGRRSDESHAKDLLSEALSSVLATEVLVAETA